MKWEEDEIEFMSAALEKGWTHKEIGIELDRTAFSIKHKAGRLSIKSLNNKLKTTQEYKKELPKDIEVLENYVKDKVKILHKHICGNEWYASPNTILNGNSCPKCAGNIKKTTEEYKQELPKDVVLLEDYINNRTALLHRHICGNEWKIRPYDILKGHSCPICNSGRKTTKQYKSELPEDIEILEDYIRNDIKILHKHKTCGYEWYVMPHSIIASNSSCPNCSASGFKDNKVGYTYFIYFKELDLYKVGITNNIQARMKEFGNKPELIFTRYFEIGLDARELEKEWLQNVNHLKINTGLLKSGNTETFRM